MPLIPTNTEKVQSQISRNLYLTLCIEGLQEEFAAIKREITDEALDPDVCVKLSWELQEDEIMETTALTDNKTVMYTSEQVQQMLDMVVRSLSNQGQKSAPVDLDNVINQVTPSDAKITLTVTEAANMLGISLPKMYEIVRMGRIPSIRVGKRIVLARQAILDWLKEGD